MPRIISSRTNPSKVEFETDADAWKILKTNFIETTGGLIKPRNPGYRPDPEEEQALRYLVGEWDYAYED